MIQYKPYIAIVDYQINNLFSVKQACDIAGIEGHITCDPETVKKADGIILPGVGAFADAMRNLRNLGLLKALEYVIENDKPLMGICLGLQLLFDQSCEFVLSEGIGIIPGNVIPIPIYEHGRKRKVPHISWNRISIKKEHSILKGLTQNDYFYFVHSFVVSPSYTNDILTTTDYEGFGFCSGIVKNNIFAFQFHPEKSGEKGLQIYKNFRDIVNTGLK